jgi:hypothetical protein
MISNALDSVRREQDWAWNDGVLPLACPLQVFVAALATVHEGMRDRS